MSHNSAKMHVPFRMLRTTDLR